MLAQKSGGSIVSITASLADNPIAGINASIPMITKGGIDAITRSLAIEYAKGGIRVNAVAPGVVDTPLHSSNPKGVFKNAIPNGKHFDRSGDCGCNNVFERGSARHRGGTARRRRRAHRQMVTNVSRKSRSASFSAGRRNADTLRRALAPPCRYDCRPNIARAMPRG
jgi:NAD(P)-dependent dehydrogenase (short-subunit alcohol dehydrogenase family)